MSEKVKLPKEVEIAIGNLINNGGSAETILINVAQAVISEYDLRILTEYIWDGTGFNGRFLALAKALINGDRIEGGELK
jgi:hypothetical protein